MPPHTTMMISTENNATPPEHTLESKPNGDRPKTIYRISSNLSFSDDEDDDEWKRELSSLTASETSSPRPSSPPKDETLRALEAIRLLSLSPASPPPSLHTRSRCASDVVGDGMIKPAPKHTRRVSAPPDLTHEKDAPQQAESPSSWWWRLKRSPNSLTPPQVASPLPPASPTHNKIPSCISTKPRKHRRSVTFSEPLPQMPSPRSRQPTSHHHLVFNLHGLQGLLQKRRKKYGDFHYKVGLTLNQIGNYHFRCHDYEAALSAYRQALECQNEIRRASDVEFIASAYANIGTVYWNTSRAKESLAPLRRAEELRIYLEKSQGRDPDQCLAVADCQHQFGLALCLLEQYKDALLALHRARRIRQRVAGHSSVIVARSLDAIGRVHFLRGEFDEAEWYHKTALSLKQEAAPAYDPTVLAAKRNIGAIQEARRNYQAAISTYEEVLKGQKTQLANAERELRGRSSIVRLARETGDSLQIIARLQLAQNNQVSTGVVQEAIQYYRRGELQDDDPKIVGLSALLSL